MIFLDDITISFFSISLYYNMVYRRRTYRKRRIVRKRRSFQKRRTFRKRGARVTRAKTMGFSRRLATTVAPIVDGVLAGTLIWRFSDLGSVTEYTSLFSEYRLNMMVIKFRYSNQIPSNEAAMVPVTQCAPNFYWVNTRKSAEAIPNLAAMQQVSESKMCGLRGQTITVKVRPWYETPRYQAGTIWAYGPTRGWVSTTYPTVPWNACNYIVDGSLNGGTGANTIGKLFIDTTCYFQCRGTK